MQNEVINMKKAGKHTETISSNLESGLQLIQRHPLFGHLYGTLSYKNQQQMGKQTVAYVCSNGTICINKDFVLNPKQWAYVIAHCYLHLAFGHFDSDKMPAYESMDSQSNIIRRNVFDAFLWNEACDIYIHRFLEDIKFGEPLYNAMSQIPGGLSDEQSIYDYLIMEKASKEEQLYGTAAPNQLDMHGLDKPIIYKKKETNSYAVRFADMLRLSVDKAVAIAGTGCGRRFRSTTVGRAAKWFTDHYPLLGALASAFEIVDDYKICQEKNIRVAAINVGKRVIYANPTCGYTQEEWKFVLAHEYLHAGLEHDKRSQGREAYLWNIACDFVINDWLREMQTFAGYDSGDIISEQEKATFTSDHDFTKVDDFCRNALRQGLEYEQTYVRVVFCDAAAYDAGYMAPEDIAGRVEVKGRGGTVLQPGVDLLEKAQDFPKEGPILIITDGMIDSTLRVRREHAFLLSQWKRLPFVSKGKIFHME